MNAIIEKFREAYYSDGVEVPEILFNCSENQEKYDQYRQIFNRQFQFMPAAIVLCETTQQVSVAVKFTSKHALPLRVRSGGHDHKGECSGTDTILLDLSKMNKVEIDRKRRIARIQPGIRFQSLTTELAKCDVMIPHGTCATVCIAGYTMGGGWALDPQHGNVLRKYSRCHPGCWVMAAYAS